MKKKLQQINKNLLGLWKFDKLAIEDMKKLTTQSKQTNLETGGLLCLDQTKKVILKNRCSGNKCEVTVKGSCDSLNKRLGIFHSHPKSSNFNLSFNDIVNYETNDDDLGCLGLGKKNSVICFKYPEHTHKEFFKRQKSKLEMYNSMNDAVTSNKKSDLEKVRKKVKLYQNEFFIKFNPEDYVSEE